jgi:hypothetical protein
VRVRFPSPASRYSSSDGCSWVWAWLGEGRPDMGGPYAASPVSAPPLSLEGTRSERRCRGLPAGNSFQRTVRPPCAATRRHRRLGGPLLKGSAGSRSRHSAACAVDGVAVLKCCAVRASEAGALVQSSWVQQALLQLLDGFFDDGFDDRVGGPRAGEDGDRPGGPAAGYQVSDERAGCIRRTNTWRWRRPGRGYLRRAAECLPPRSAGLAGRRGRYADKPPGRDAGYRTGGD